MRNLLIIFSILAIASCTYRNEEELKPIAVNQSCDTVNVLYSSQITSILKKSCFSCHSDATADQNATISFETYDYVNADMDEIVKRITYPTSNSRFMPKNGSKLSDCEINQIKSWVKKGGPNN